MRTSPLCLAILGLAACEGGGPAAPVADPAPTLTVDASTGWAFARLGDAATLVAVSDPDASMEWDIGFFATSVMLNGGAAGPAGVRGVCLCHNSNATDAQIMAMTAAGEEPAFEAVDASAIPAEEEAWESDVLDPAIDGWWSYDAAAHEVSAVSSRVWKIRLAGGSYAKFHVTEIQGAAREHAGQVTFAYALQPAAGAPFGEVRNATIDLSAGPVRFDFEAGTTAGDAAWDLAFEGYSIRVNGGVSGTGGTGAVLADEAFDEMADAGDAPAEIYRGDAFGGVFAAYPWYRYNLQGNHQIWPTYDVYLIRRGETVWKVQLIGYYDAGGNSRRITLRYGKLAG